jgi:hypothetical protein
MAGETPPWPDIPQRALCAWQGSSIHCLKDIANFEHTTFEHTTLSWSVPVQFIAVGISTADILIITRVIKNIPLSGFNHGGTKNTTGLHLTEEGEKSNAVHNYRR